MLYDQNFYLIFLYRDLKLINKKVKSKTYNNKSYIYAPAEHKALQQYNIIKFKVSQS